jgi:hypothetical protein
MNLQSLLGGIAIGRDNSGNFRPSLKGVAVRIEKNRFVTLDNGQLLDVTPLAFDNADDANSPRVTWPSSLTHPEHTATRPIT